MVTSDDIRRYCIERYIDLARDAGESLVRIRAGDVHKALGLKDRMPKVCSALGSNIFLDQANVTRRNVEGPINGANAVFVFCLK